ncbi:NF-X1-type zinc finger protein NFXL1 [Camponotus floridanus]|uniref:NF-X1-type zinc finger protein NFXL1 n=1 Tax=Camponotus floridanus TaxID=104421 RepID=E2A0N5_CAMFO|nr:NF-X1-type zinc finger protein NFXL1 [Camponotus floridanus]XP_011268929.1 NF-X1-type zinc finger protein NFXL1 [Camponotus floridanus]EFN72938.1 NF-X1-type zinc finger protein NFXL1 [Camponotus floridanus]
MQKFRRAQAQNKLSIERHLEANMSLNSSSEEEDETNEEDVQNVVGKVLSAYQGQSTDAEKVISYLINSFQSSSAVCLICISTVKKIDPIWNCNKCYAFLHMSCILRWINDSLSYKQAKGIIPIWACPKCRMEYNQDQIPRSYECFCKKTINPPYQPWIIPHSCGETCSKLLQPECGHKCVLLCHPGPCPPCAKMVSVKCYCGKLLPQPRRCNAKNWSCGTVCDKKYEFCSHTCNNLCHAGECPPCMEIVSLKCHCKSNQKEGKCYEGTWSCERLCNRKFSCNVHICESTCHLPDDCGNCPLEKNRCCPCGKKRYDVSCRQQQVPTCGDTCGKLLDCGSHFCNMRCHIDRCGQCLEVITKACRCSSYTKEIACGKEFHCNKKCTQMRLCGRHLCNKKCCDCILKNTSNPCEKTCENMLNCRKHKCAAPCHSGPCYPCTRMDTVQCRCGSSKITVPCGTRKRIKPPPCNKSCKIPPDCHHNKRETHRCHQGPCPPCKKICGLIHKRCGHSCPATCHTKVWVKVKANGVKAQPIGPWEKPGKDIMELKTLPCPPCEISVLVTCLGGHETRPWPCHMSKPSSCGRACDQLLPCKNHTCELTCHKIQTSDNKSDSGIPCMECEKECQFVRLSGCTHACPEPCHPAPCKPCKQLVRISCHCGISTLYRHCVDLITATNKKHDELLKCGNQCPKNYSCGHRCINDCHPGECKGQEQCSKKVRLWCKCKRIKKDFLCLRLQKEQITVECDNVCESLKIEKKEAQEAIIAKKREAEELRNREEIEKFEKKFKPRRKRKDKYENSKLSQGNMGNNCWNTWILAIVVSIIGIVIVYMISFDSSMLKMS